MKKKMLLNFTGVVGLSLAAMSAFATTPAATPGVTKGPCAPQPTPGWHQKVILGHWSFTVDNESSKPVYLAGINDDTHVAVNSNSLAAAVVSPGTVALFCFVVPATNSGSNISILKTPTYTHGNSTNFDCKKSTPSNDQDAYYPGGAATHGNPNFTGYIQVTGDGSICHFGEQNG